MKIKFALLLVLTLCLGALACQERDSGQPKAGVVDLSRLMRESSVGKEGIKFIEGRQAELQKQLDAIQNRLEKNPQDEASLQELQRLYASSQEIFQAESQNVASQILDLVQRVMNAFREERGYSFLALTDALASFDPKIDVTNAVLEMVNKEKIEFKPLVKAPANPVPATNSTAPQ